MLIRYLALKPLTMRHDFTFSNFLAQITQVSRLGPAPSRLIRRLGLPDIDPTELESQLRRATAIGSAMTEWERDHAEQLDASRRRRIATGAGVTIIEVSQLIRQFEMTQQMMQRVNSSAWTRMAAVLGLVTNEPAHRDPSHVAPLVDREFWHRAQIAIVLALYAFLLVYALVRHG
jgi:signal recognition particle GTPase